MAQYEVTKATYVPVGPGFKHKRPGQIVTLKAADARKLGDSVRKVDADEGVAKRNTAESDTAESDTAAEVDTDSSTSAVLATETVRVVTPDASEETPADQRAGTEAAQ